MSVKLSRLKACYVVSSVAMIWTLWCFTLNATMLMAESITFKSTLRLCFRFLLCEQFHFRCILLCTARWLTQQGDIDWVMSISTLSQLAWSSRRWQTEWQSFVKHGKAPAVAYAGFYYGESARAALTFCGSAKMTIKMLWQCGITHVSYFCCFRMMAYIWLSDTEGSFVHWMLWKQWLRLFEFI